VGRGQEVLAPALAPRVPRIPAARAVASGIWIGKHDGAPTLLSKGLLDAAFTLNRPFLSNSHAAASRFVVYR